MCACSVAKSCLTLCDPMDCSSPDSSVHGISQARILEWFGISSSRTSLYSLYFNLKLNKFNVRDFSQQSLYILVLELDHLNRNLCVPDVWPNV